ncbi:hypothetical protein CR513_20765, partial [Mucuna pruriens]
MVHLTCHLVEEVKLGGPVYYRWMHLIQRCIIVGCIQFKMLGYLKSFVRNRTQPEGSISEVYLVEETRNFYSLYEEVESRLNRKKTQAHRYLLLNFPKVQSYVDEFKTFIKRKIRNQRLSVTELEKIVSKEFVYWFLHWVMNPNSTTIVPDEIKYLARGPMAIARRYTAFSSSNTSCVASKANANLRLADLPYYRKFGRYN